MRKQCLIFRDSTERPETIESGNSILINKSFKNLNKIESMIKENLASEDIKDYKVKNVSQIVSNIINSDLNF